MQKTNIANMTSQSSNDKSAPRFGAAAQNKRIATGNAGNSRARAGMLQPIAPATANTDGRAVTSIRAISDRKSIEIEDIGPNKINIVAKKRPPPMSIGFNENGIDMTR